jgi:hypothetical protein
MGISSYGSIYSIGHRAASEILVGPVVVEEKVDGSQFSFGLYVNKADQEPFQTRCRSKGAELQMAAPEKMFQKAVDTVRELAPLLRPGWTYRGEYLAKPKHNALAYDRVPQKNIIIYDIDRGDQHYLSVEERRDEAQRISLEVVPVLFRGKGLQLEDIRHMLATVSVLGGQNIEGVVVKNYAKYGPDKKVLMAKFVSEAFKEVHAGEWKAANPSAGDVIQLLADRYKTPARWQKAVQHLREAGRLDGTPRDIGHLFREVPADILKECEDEIKAELFKWAWPKVQRIATAGLAEWYKEQLLVSQFEPQPV